LPLQLGQPPADTAVFAPLMAALQELQVRRHGLADVNSIAAAFRCATASSSCLCYLLLVWWVEVFAASKGLNEQMLARIVSPLYKAGSCCSCVYRRI
jgi:hypothetical protein